MIARLPSVGTEPIPCLAAELLWRRKPSGRQRRRAQQAGRSHRPLQALRQLGQGQNHRLPQSAPAWGQIQATAAPSARVVGTQREGSSGGWRDGNRSGSCSVFMLCLVPVMCLCRELDQVRSMLFKGLIFWVCAHGMCRSKGYFDGV